MYFSTFRKSCEKDEFTGICEKMEANFWKGGCGEQVGGAGVLGPCLNV